MGGLMAFTASSSPDRAAELQRLAKPCKRCGKSFAPRSWKKRLSVFDKQKFCSRSCSLLAEKNKHAEVREKKRKPCQQCGEAIPGIPAKVAASRFCSRRCSDRARVLQRPACEVCGKEVNGLDVRACSKSCGYEMRKRSNRPQKACAECGEKYWPVPFNKTKFCSRKCYSAHKSRRPALLAQSCERCGASFWRTAAAVKRVKRSFCSKACSQEYFTGTGSPMHRGYKAHGWRGKGWNALREQIRKRDGYTCQRCNRTQEENGMALPVDHIIPWHTFEDKEAANHPSNLVSLCSKCHGSKTSGAERKWLKGDAIAMLQYRRSIKLKPLFASVVPE